eukprot:maker-scaffold48_size466083-snap-gene-3.21 protein:Tk05981 transcript:maker-scaffold48_size466083-snap-gene-3.21-mRNA-1 annotation:"evolutionarily conserved signaling intermediate in toll mitochondrial"
MACSGLRWSLLAQRQARQCLAVSSRPLSLSRVHWFDDKSVNKALIAERRTQLNTKDAFEKIDQKNKETFRNALDLFTRSDTKRRGNVEFINSALQQMEAYGVHRDLDTYRALIDIMPKGKYVPENKIQSEFKHFPKHQDCIVDLLSQMGKNQVQPDLELGSLIVNIFGFKSSPYRLFCRMLYWMPKLKNLSPFPLPFHLPKESLELAKLAIKQITTPDTHTVLSIYDAEDLEESIDKTWIVSGQSPLQAGMIKSLPKNKALYVEGAFRVWLRKTQVNYFILRGDPIPRPPPPEGDVDDVSQMKNWYLGEHAKSDAVRLPNVHEQVEGTIFGCCATGTSSKDSLLSWIRFLQRDNPDLMDIPILFTLTSPLGPVIPIDSDSIGVRKAN